MAALGHQTNILKLWKWCTVQMFLSTNKEFQRTFNGFYIVRRNEEWREKYYNLFEQKKMKDVTFEEILQELYDLTGNVEASFSSKMYATIYPDKPIWDRYVVQNLGIKVPEVDKEEKIRIIKKND